MSAAIRTKDVAFNMRLNDANALTFERVMAEHWNAFAAIWWDIGLVATPARSILAAASVAHDAVDEWRAEFPYLLHDVPCCFRITRHTWSRAVDARAHWARKNPGFKRDVRNTLRAWERKEWPSLPNRNDYRGNVHDTAWLQDARPWLNDVSGPTWDLSLFATPPQRPNCRSFARWDEVATTPIEDMREAANAMYRLPQRPFLHLSAEMHARMGAAFAKAIKPKTKRRKKRSKR